MKIVKMNMILIWLFLLVAQVLPVLEPIKEGCLIALMILPVAHTLEFFAYLPLLKKVEGSMQKHFLQVFLYGVIYYFEVKKTVAAS